MNTVTNYIDQIKRAILVSVMALSVASCGSAIVSAGISGTGIVFGSITGFGSIFVNGVEYEIDAATFNVDGNTTATQNDLKVGMVVKLKATDNGDGTGDAVSVFYDAAVEGPIQNLSDTTESKTFNVFGLTVIMNATSTAFEDGASFDGLQNDNVVEVSGFIDQAGQIIATLVELKALTPVGSEVEIHGQVSNLVVNTSFEINGVTVHYSSATPLEDLDTGLSNDLYVEVEATYIDPSNIQATRIEGEDDDRDEIEQSDGEVSLQGIITAFNSSSDFSVNGIPVLVDTSQVDAAILAQLFLGMQIEVEGEMVNGVLEADEVEVREGKRKYQAEVVAPVVNQTVSIGYPGIPGVIELVVDSNSQLEDELTDSALNLADLMVGDEVKVEARVVDNEKRITSLKRDTIEKYEISGIVETFTPNVSITIDSLQLPIEPGADLEPPTLFSSLQVGDIVEMEDEDKDTNPSAMFESVELQ